VCVQERESSLKDETDKDAERGSSEFLFSICPEMIKGQVLLSNNWRLNMRVCVYNREKIGARSQ